MSPRGDGYIPRSRDEGEKDWTTKRIIIAGIATIFVFAMVVAVTMTFSPDYNDGEEQNAQRKAGLSTSLKAIKAFCQPTDYKETCQSSLSSATKNTTDHKELVKLAFQITMRKVKEVLRNSTTLKRTEKDPRAKKALKNCEELMGYAIDDLKTSLDHVDPFDLSKLEEVVEDVRLWLSASGTYLETCLDGFEGTKGDAHQKMKKFMKPASELVSNILAIITEISTLMGEMGFDSMAHRRLLEKNAWGDDVPAWVTDHGRKLLGIRNMKPNVVVAKDGSGKFRTIKAAVATIPLKSNHSFVIYIKEGLYEEQVVIDKKMWNVVMIGDGPNKTRITGKKNFVDGTPTFKTATVAVMGEGFHARGIGFENTAGPEKHQAVALRVQADQAIFYNCHMDGYQDTLYFHTHRQFYRDCTISGTIDFLFGNAAAILQNCQLVVRKPLDNQKNIITAHGRKDRKEPTGVILHNCTILAHPDYAPVKNKVPTYLGRPWKKYSRTLYIQSDLGDFVNPAGWLPWEGDFALNTCIYGEYHNRGPAAVQTNRVKWKGIKSVSKERVEKFTVERFIRGRQWIKASRVPFSPGLFSSL